MRLQRSKILFVVCSALMASACGSLGKNAPVIDVCVSDPADSGAQCVDKKQKPYFRAYGETENYVMLSPSDAEALFNYCKKK